LRHKTITQVEYMLGDSHFWSGLMEIKNDLLRMGKFTVGYGSQTRFWEDAWLESIPFKSQYLSLYNIVRKKSATVATVLRLNPLNVAFRRSLVGNNLQA
jgi:type V secretory pathway adhesin AidA